MSPIALNPSRAVSHCLCGARGVDWPGEVARGSCESRRRRAQCAAAAGGACVGSLVAAEWAHFVALGVFAYRVGGTSAVGIAGSCGCCPRPCSLRSRRRSADRFRASGSCSRSQSSVRPRSAVSALGSACRTSANRRAAAAVVGISSTLFRPALQALLPSLASTPRGADRGERRDVDARERSARSSARSLAGRPVATADVSASSPPARPRLCCPPCCSAGSRRRRARRR